MIRCVWLFKSPITHGNFRRNQCLEDWVEIYQIYRDEREELVGRYCSQSAPGPVVSLSDVAVGLKVFLHTDSKHVYSGFLGKYDFFPAKSTEKKGKYFISMSLQLNQL